MGFKVIVPKIIVNKLKAEAREALRIITHVRSLGKEIPGMDRMAIGIVSAVEEGRFAWLRRVLGCYIVRKCRELTLNDSFPANALLRTD